MTEAATIPLYFRSRCDGLRGGNRSDEVSVRVNVDAVTRRAHSQGCPCPADSVGPAILSAPCVRFRYILLTVGGIGQPILHERLGSH